MNIKEDLRLSCEKAKENNFELQFGEVYFRTIIESSFNGISIVDEQGNFEFVNDSFLKMIDWPREDIIGQHFLIIIPEDTHEFAIKAANDLHKGLNNIKKIKIKTKRGEIKYLKSFHKLFKINGNLKTISIIEDLTEEIRLTRELNKSNKQKKLLYYLIKGTRGGRTRALILKNLIDKSYNANQLAKALNMDYKTIRHHLYILIKNGIIKSEKNGSKSAIYFISNNISANFNDLDIIF
jgi:PAS domain S-box-containing protein